jgi:hypothetical protein
MGAEKVLFQLKRIAEPEFLNFSGAPRNQSRQPMLLGGLAGRHDNSIPTRFLAPIDCLKIPALGYAGLIRD